MTANGAIHVLLVEDNPADTRLVQETLAQAAGALFRLECADRLAKGASRLLQGGIDVVLLDLGLPDSQGLATFQQIHQRQPEVPVVILSGAIDEDLAMAAVEAGAQDYLVKGTENRQVLTRALRYAIERKRADEQVRQLNAELRQRNRELEEQYRQVEACSRLKSEFLANMSHELRSPLNGIIGFTELLYDGKLGAPAESQRECLGRILGSARHLLRLINDVLDLARIEAGKLVLSPEPIIVSHLVEEACESLAAVAAEKRIEIKYRIFPDLDAVIDPARLKEVAYNYLSNALKFTPPSGQVTVAVMPEGSGEFRLEVADTGPGIAEEDLCQLFTDFHQIDSGKGKRFQGTGLGLALTRRIVEAQGGTVGVRSVVGEGSTFFAVLPRVTGENMANASRADSDCR
jgi:signal transduction histidine kinase